MPPVPALTGVGGRSYACHVRHAQHDDPVYGITTAQQSHMADIAKRQKQYVITMTFRIVALLVVLLVPGLTILERVVLGVAVTVIPYVAVIRANGGQPPSDDPTNLLLDRPDQTSIGQQNAGLPGGNETLSGDGAADGAGRGRHEEPGAEPDDEQDEQPSPGPGVGAEHR